MFVQLSNICYTRRMKRRKRRKKANFITVFLITLTFVVLTGLFVVFSYLWIAVDTGSGQNLDKTASIKGESIKINNKLASDENKKEQEDNEKEPEEIEKEPEDKAGAEEEYALGDNTFTKEAASEERVVIAFAGDILFDANYAIMVSLQQRGGDISRGIMPEVIEEMTGADIMMLNNEFPYSDRGTPTPDKAFTFRAKPSTVSYLGDLGVDIVSLANNHAYDHGEEAFLDTLQTLKDAGIHYVGAGVNAEEAQRPVYYIINDMKIAFVCATQIERNETPDTKEATETTPGVFRCWNGEKLLQTVKETKENSDFVIVYVHWGTENQVETDWAQEKQARELVEAGADLIVGDHPHCLQKIEIINGVPVFYSLGNFWFNSKQLDTGLLKVTVSEGKLESCQFLPCLQSNCTTTMLGGAEKERVLEFMRSMSENVSIDADGYIGL